MAIQRDNDEERAAIVERLVEENRRLSRKEPVQVSTRKPRAAERRQSERRRHRSDVELRQQRAELEFQWNAKNRRRQRNKVS